MTLRLAAALATALATAPALADCPPWAGRGVATETCAAVEACVARAYVPRAAAPGVTDREAALASERDAYARCAWAAQTASVANARAVALLTPVPRCPEPVACEPCATVERPIWVDAASHTGACVLCGAVVAAGAVAACGGGP